MSEINKTAEVSVSVNGTAAKKELEALQQGAKKLRSDINNAYGDKTTNKKLRTELRDVKRQIAKLKVETFDFKEALIGLDNASPRELRNTLRMMYRQLNNTPRGTKDFKELSQAIGQVRGELSSIYQEQKVDEPMMTRFTNNMKSMFTSWIGQLALVSGATMSIQQSISAYVSIEESLSDVRKYTGLAGAELKQLQDRFKQMDTRRAREELNRFAGEAGRLGLNTVDAVYDFVEVADILNNALGADLGEDGIRQIGKIAEYFGEKDKIGLRASMLATGSAINELGQASSANEAFIAEFLSRIAQVGKVANISQTDIMGFASTLDQSMSSVERSSTALQNVILKMTTDPTEYAKVAGVSIKEFSSIVKNDANEALMMFFEGLNRLGGLTEIAPVLDKMQLSGQGVASTITAMASNLDKVREAQSLANDAYAQGNSVIDEASIVNNTAAAQIEKKKNQLREYSAEIGEKLLPVQLAAMDGAKQAMKVLAMTIKFIYEHRTALFTLITAIATYKLAVKAATIQANVFAAAKHLLAAATSLFTGNIKKATIAFRSFTQAAKANPFGMLLAAIVATVGAMKYIFEQLDKGTSITKEFANMNKEASKSISNERVQVEALYKVAINDNASKEKRLAAIEELNKISPEYLGNLDLETIKTDKARESIDQYITSLKNQELAKRTVQKLADVQEKYDEWLDKVNRLPWLKSVYEMTEAEAKQAKQMAAKNDLLRRELGFKKDIAEWTEKVDKYTSKSLESKAKKEKTDENEDDNGDDDPKKKPPVDPEDILKQRVAALDKWHSIEKAKIAGHYANGLIDKADYDKQVEELDKANLQKRIDLYAEGTKERADLEAQLFTKQGQLADKQTEEELAKTREALAREANEQKQAMGRQYVDGTMSYESYKQNMFNIELKYQQDLAATYAAGSKERLDIEQKTEEMLLKDKLEKQKEFERVKQQLYQQYSELNKAEMFNLEMSALEALHDEKLISEENFLKAKKELEQNYEEDFSETFLETEAGQKMLNKTQFALAQMQTIMGGFNNFMMAESDAQVASIERKYEAETRAAGNNQFKLRQIEERKQKEIARVKAKYASKALIVQMAMAVAQAVQGSINAYTSTAAIPIIGPKMAPIAAGIAMAAGMLNVAAITKQHEAAKKGFYKGGYTGSGRWNEERGVVHANEFVANRHAVRNPEIRPVLDFIDTAQRNNTIGSITAEDITAQLYPGTRSIVTENRTTTAGEVDNSELIKTLSFTAQTISELKERLAEPFVTINTVDGDYGIKQALDKFQAQEKNKSR